VRNSTLLTEFTLFNGFPFVTLLVSKRAFFVSVLVLSTPRVVTPAYIQVDGHLGLQGGMWGGTSRCA
jgi:hypothetical protein